MRFMPIYPELATYLGSFLEQIARHKSGERFKPHGMDFDTATTLCSARTQDFYAVLMRENAILAYGMLRGWQDGWPVPSLGIAVAHEHRGKGVGKTLMGLLHLEARLRGADHIRLRVHPTNEAAMRLYRSLGYHFSGDTDRDQLVGMLSLRTED